MTAVDKNVILKEESGMDKYVGDDQLTLFRSPWTQSRPCMYSRPCEASNNWINCEAILTAPKNTLLILTLGRLGNARNSLSNFRIPSMPRR